MTRILAIGYAAAEYLRGQPPAHSFPDTLTRDDLERVVDAVAGDLEEGAVVAIYPAWHPHPSLQRLQTVRAALDSPYVALYASSLPPLAGSVLCALAAAVAAYIPSPGILIAGLPVLERSLLPMARLRSVARLHHPAPSVGQHLASWWPTSNFGVSWWPEPSVRRLRRHDQSVPLPPAEHSALALNRLAVSAPNSGAVAWVRDAIVSPLEVQEVVGADPMPLAGRYWGTTSVLEAVAYPGDVGGMATAVITAGRAHPCRWCGQLIVASECPLCGMDRALAPTRAAG